MEEVERCRTQASGEVAGVRQKRLGAIAHVQGHEDAVRRAGRERDRPQRAHQDVARRRADQFLRHAAQHEPPQPALAMRADHDQVGVHLVEIRQDLRRDGVGVPDGAREVAEGRAGDLGLLAQGGAQPVLRGAGLEVGGLWRRRRGADDVEEVHLGARAAADGDGVSEGFLREVGEVGGDEDAAHVGCGGSRRQCACRRQRRTEGAAAARCRGGPVNLPGMCGFPPQRRTRKRGRGDGRPPRQRPPLAFVGWSTHAPLPS